MAISKSAQLNAVNQTLVTTYDAVFQNIKSNVTDLVSTESIGTKKYVHAFSAGFPKMRKWDGEKLAKSLMLKEIIGQAEPYEVTVEVDVDDLLSPILRPILTQLENMGSVAAVHVDQLVADFLQGGTSTSTTGENFDGAALFATHTNEDGSTQSNNITTSALSSANLQIAITRMMGFTCPLGIPLKLKPTHLIVPSALYFTAKALVENPFDASGATNVLHGTLKIVHLPELDAQTTTWYLASVDGSATPFINYELQPAEMTVLNSPESESYFWKDKVVYSTTAKRQVKAGPWFLLLRSIA